MSRAFGVVLLTAVVTAMLGVGVVVLVPPIWGAATTVVADQDTTSTIRAQHARASVPVPRGWAMRPSYADDSRVTLTSPDGRMRVELALREGGDPSVIIGDIAPGPLAPLSREPTRGGGELLHTTTSDGRVIVGVVVAGSTRVSFVSRPAEGYDAELAEMLAQIEVTR